VIGGLKTATNYIIGDICVNSKPTEVLLRITVEKDINVCKERWEQFSPKNTLWELWGTAFAHYDDILFEPYFIGVMEAGKPVGLLPLCTEKKTGRHISFGSEYMEDRHFWFAAEHFPLVFSSLPPKTAIHDINHAEAERLFAKLPEAREKCLPEDNHYFINLERMSYDVSRHLASFGKKHRKNLLYDLRKVEGEGFIVRWSTAAEYYDEFVAFNLERWGKDSNFVEAEFVAGMKRFLVFLEQQGLLHTLIILKDDSLVGIEYSALYDNVYYVLNGGYDLARPNVGKYLIMLHLQKAARLRARIVDFLSGDSGWKEMWNCEKVPYYTYRMVPLKE